MEDPKVPPPDPDPKNPEPHPPVPDPDVPELDPDVEPTLDPERAGVSERRLENRRKRSFSLHGASGVS